MGEGDQEREGLRGDREGGRGNNSSLFIDYFRLCVTNCLIFINR